MRCLWAVYECHDDYPVVWPIRPGRNGEYSPIHLAHMPHLSPFPLSIHKTEAAANRALNCLAYDCAGTA